MHETVTFLMAMSCVIPAAAGLYQYKRVDSRYRPFIYMMLIDVLIELIYYITLRNPEFGRFNQLAVNLYMLTNFTLFLYFVQINGYLEKRAMQLFLALGILVAAGNWAYYHTAYKAFFYLLCFVSAVMLFISINILSRQMMAIRVKLANNSWFWISCFSVVYNAFNLLIFGLYIFAMFQTPNGKAISIIQHFANTACYLAFAVAILRLPQKRPGSKTAFGGKE